MQKDFLYWNSKEHKIFLEYSKGVSSWKRNFKKLIWSFHKENRRDFLWRRNISPYRVLVSEFMLQQTQTTRVREKFPEFIKAFPSLKSLAEASPAEVLKLWSGLGYNRRAIFLHNSAKIIRDSYRGRVPFERELLLSLPGIGAGTVSAIRVFAYNLPDVIIETNIRTVYRKFFFPKDTNISDSSIAPLMEMTMDTANPREWYYALTDYGVFLKQNGYQVNSVFKGYRPQTKFQGSRRQVRGEVLRILITEGKISKRKMSLRMQSEFSRSSDEILSICMELEKDGLITIRDGNLLLVS